MKNFKLTFKGTHEDVRGRELGVIDWIWSDFSV